MELFSSLFMIIWVRAISSNWFFVALEGIGILCFLIAWDKSSLFKLFIDKTSLNKSMYLYFITLLIFI